MAAEYPPEIQVEWAIFADAPRFTFCPELPFFFLGITSEEYRQAFEVADAAVPGEDVQVAPVHHPVLPLPVPHAAEPEELNQRHKCCLCHGEFNWYVRSSECISSTCFTCIGCLWGQLTWDRPGEIQKQPPKWKCLLCNRSSYLLTLFEDGTPNRGMVYDRVMRFLNIYWFDRIWPLFCRTKFQEDYSYFAMGSGHYPVDCMTDAIKNPLRQLLADAEQIGARHFDADRIREERATSEEVAATIFLPDIRYRERRTPLKWMWAVFTNRLPCPPSVQAAFPAAQLAFAELAHVAIPGVHEINNFDGPPIGAFEQLMFFQQGPDALREYRINHPEHNPQQHQIPWVDFDLQAPQELEVNPIVAQDPNEVAVPHGARRPICYRCQAHGCDVRPCNEEVDLFKPDGLRVPHRCPFQGCGCRNCIRALRRLKPKSFMFDMAIRVEQNSATAFLPIKVRTNTPMYEVFTPFRNLVENLNAVEVPLTPAQIQERLHLFQDLPFNINNQEALVDYVQYPDGEVALYTDRVPVFHDWFAQVPKYLSATATANFLNLFAARFGWPRTIFSYFADAGQMYQYLRHTHELGTGRGRKRRNGCPPGEGQYIKPIDVIYIRVCGSPRTPGSTVKLNPLFHVATFRKMVSDLKPEVVIPSPFVASLMAGDLETRIGALNFIHQNPVAREKYEEAVQNQDVYFYHHADQQFMVAPEASAQWIRNLGRSLNLNAIIAELVFDICFKIMSDDASPPFEVMRNLPIQLLRTRAAEIRAAFETKVTEVNKYQVYQENENGQERALRYLNFFFDFLLQENYNEEQWLIVLEGMGAEARSTHQWFNDRRGHNAGYTPATKATLPPSRNFFYVQV